MQQLVIEKNERKLIPGGGPFRTVDEIFPYSRQPTGLGSHPSLTLLQYYLVAYRRHVKCLVQF